MKKRLYTLLMVLFVTFVTIGAQNFEFQYQGKSLDDGTTVAIAAQKNDFDELACETNPSSNPGNGLVLKLLEVTNAEVSASLRVKSNTLNPSMIQWCMGGNCTIISGTSTKYKTFAASTVEQVQFDATNIQAEGILEATLSATIGGVTKSVNILFTNNPKQMWWNYYNNETGWYVDGTFKAERYYVATHVPYGTGGDGCTIDGISLFFYDPEISDIQYWVSTTLPEFGGQADLETVEIPMSDFKYSSFNQVKFKKSHVIPQGGLYVGCSFTILALNESDSNYPISYRMSKMPCTQGFFMSTSSSTSWRVHEGDLTVRILSSGQFNNNAVKVFADDHVYTIKGTEQTMNVRLQNVGATPVKSVRYVIETDGEQVASGTCNTSIQNMMSASTISIPIPTDVEASIYDRTIVITEVNSQPNESDNNKVDTKQYNLLETSQFVPLFEEFTATWCGYCPRGFVAMKRAFEQYGDKAIIIAAHYADPMGTDDYAPVFRAFYDGCPSGVANRKDGTGIGTNTVVYNIENTIDNFTPAAIAAEAYWANAEQTAIKVDTKTTFQINMTGNYAIAYVLVADGLTGTGSSWAQSNYYSGQSDTDPDMQYWCQQPSLVRGVAFDHVAVAAWQPFYGVEGSVGRDIKAGVPQTYSFIADIKGNTIIQNKSKLRMITMLLNADTGEYINAAQTTIKEYEPSAVEEIDSAERFDADANAPIYDLMGRRLQQKPANGYYIQGGKKYFVK